MLEIAQHLAAERPRRSVLFVWHTAEEQGLLGSQHFTEHPTVSIDSVVAMINMDMVGRNGGVTENFLATGGVASADRLFVVGPAAAPNRQSRVLGTVVDSVNASLANPFTLDRTWDDPDHPERLYFRSDHYNYAQKGIPIVFFTMPESVHWLVRKQPSGALERMGDAEGQTTWIEPIWKMLWSNKGILPVLHRLFPENPHVLPAFFDGEQPDSLTSFVRKPLYSREGANVALVSGHSSAPYAQAAGVQTTTPIPGSP